MISYTCRKREDPLWYGKVDRSPVLVALNPVLVAEVVVICKTIKEIKRKILLKMENSIMENDSQIVINFILDEIMAPSLISNLVFDIFTLIQNFKHIHLIILIEYQLNAGYVS